MDDRADLRLADHVAATLCDAIAATLRTTSDPAQLDRRLRVLRLVWAGEDARLTGGEIAALATEVAGRPVLLVPDKLGDTAFPPALARALLALAAGLAPLLPPSAFVALAGEPAAHVLLAPTGPGAAWPPALTAALAEAADPFPGPLAYALRVARAAGWRVQMLLGASAGTPPLLLTASA